MSHPRLSLVLQQEQLSLPNDGKIAVFAPTAQTDLSDLPKEQVTVIQPFKPDHDAFARLGFEAVVQETGNFAIALVHLPRAKALAHDLIARASEVADLVLVDGLKTDGVDSILKNCRKRTEVIGTVSKAHGKLFWFKGGDFQDWRAEGYQKIEGDFITKAGVFSADGIDPASRLLAKALPSKLGKFVADLGAGWGYLSAQVAQNSDLETLYLVEADHAALDCAAENVSSEKARFHWADAARWEYPTKMNAVVMNPPFHQGRKADPELGRQFITAAAKMLAPNGHLWMVANRHLPYETHLETCFAKVQEVAGDSRFKVLHAERPSRKLR